MLIDLVMVGCLFSFHGLEGGCLRYNGLEGAKGL